MLQQDGLLPWKTTLDNVAMGLIFTGVKPREARDRARPWLTRVGLARFADRYPHQLSGGMKKRAALAQMLILAPPIVLMDEPFSALDLQTRHLMQNELLELWQEQRMAVLFITHDLQEAITLADSVVVMSAGPAARPLARFPVDLARPRDVTEVVLTEQYRRSTPTSGTCCATRCIEAMSVRINVRLTRYAVLVGALGLWEMGGRTGAIDPFFFPLPSSIIAQIAEWAVTPRIYGDLAITLMETELGFVAGTLLGVVLDLWLGLNPFASQVLEPFLKAFNAIPRIVLAPIFALWFGLGLASKVAIVVTLVFFMAFFNTYQGVHDVNPVVLANAKLLHARGGLLLRHVYLPSAAQWILSSLRASIGFAVTGAVVGEYLGSAAGIGHVIAQAEGSFDSVGVFAGLTVLGIFVLLLDAGISAVERRVIVWRPQQEHRG